VPIYALPEDHIFPNPELADESGLLAVGGDLDPARVLLGYSIGVFPWYSEGQPILWHSPDPRFVLHPGDLHVGRSLRQRLKQRPYEISIDRDFSSVIQSCQKAPRPGQDGTWITGDMQDAYIALHEAGFAHSVEAWEEGELVGGLYGVSLGSVFFGESMFAKRPDASKVAFVALVQQLVNWNFDLLDSQVHTEHLERFGAYEIDRSSYLDVLSNCLDKDTRCGPWSWDSDPYDLALEAAG
jgi:leucyl/phenylalanyl-tRNA--protein transferase